MTLPAADAIAKAFIYGYPLVYDLDEVGHFVGGGGTLPIDGPFNQLVAARDLLGPETKFVTPNNDTLYLMGMCDVRGCPLVLEVPEVADRYYVLQLVDAWSNNFAYIGTRATGTGAATYLLVEPGYDGDVPGGATVVEAPTGVFSIVGRVQVHGAADLEAVRACQDRFVLAPLVAGTEPVGLPASAEGVADDLAWWESFRVRLAAFPPPPADEEFVALCAQLGLTDAESPYVDPPAELRDALVAGEAAGRSLIEELSKGSIDANGWRSAVHVFDYNLDHLGLGTIDDPAWKIADRTVAYATRAVAARQGLWGNHGYEAAYFITFLADATEQLNGQHAYELRLPSAPPVGAFWSLSMYDATDFWFVANEIDRYSIGSTTDGLVTAADGSITITMSAARPAPERVANWLPAPTGDFRPVLRMYVPGPEVLDGTYVIPAIRRIS